MTEDNKDPSGTPPVDPVDPVGNLDVDPVDNEQVSRRAYNKALSEKRTALARLKELESSNDSRRQEQLDKDGSLQDKIDFYKTKNDEFVTQLESLQGELSGEKNKWNEVRKVTACQDALPFSLPSKYFVHLDTESIVLDPETGSPDAASVQKVVDNFQKEHPAIVASFAPKGKSPGEFPANHAASTLTAEQYAKLPHAEKISRKGEMLANMK